MFTLRCNLDRHNKNNLRIRWTGTVHPMKYMDHVLLCFVCFGTATGQLWCRLVSAMGFHILASRYFILKSDPDSCSIEGIHFPCFTSLLHKQLAKHDIHYNDVIMGAIASQTPASRLFAQSFIQTQIKENIKALRHWPLCGEFTGDRWIPRTNGQ